MKQSVIMFGSVLVLGLLAAPAWAEKCPKDSVPVGNLCVDTYEASVWEIPAGNKALINQVVSCLTGRVTSTAWWVRLLPWALARCSVGASSTSARAPGYLLSPGSLGRRTPTSVLGSGVRASRLALAL